MYKMQSNHSNCGVVVFFFFFHDAINANMFFYYYLQGSHSNNITSISNYADQLLYLSTNSLKQRSRGHNLHAPSRPQARYEWHKYQYHVTLEVESWLSLSLSLSPPVSSSSGGGGEEGEETRGEGEVRRLLRPSLRNVCVREPAADTRRKPRSHEILAAHRGIFTRGVAPFNAHSARPTW